MAVDSGAAPNQMLKSPKKKESKSQQVALLSSPPKRNNSPGIRLVGCRIYDSVNGKTCHQCRQKTRDFSAACKNQRNNKPCPIMYCHKCLSNRYGEKAEEVDALGEWSCPKCRGICNCSVCMKKRGHQPTGILINTAKKTGFSSVSEMLLKGNCENVVAVMTASPKKVASLRNMFKFVALLAHALTRIYCCHELVFFFTALKLQDIAPLPMKRGKENYFDGKVDANLPNDNGKKSKKVKEFYQASKDDGTSISQSPRKRKLEQEAHAKIHDYDKKLGAEDTGSCGTKKSKKMKRDRSHKQDKKDDVDKLKEKSVNDVEKKPKKSRKDELKNDDSKRVDVTLARRTSPRKLVASSKISNNQETKLNVGVDPNENITVTRKDLFKPLETDTIKGDEIITANAQVVSKQQNSDFHPNIPLPLGTELNTVAGIDVSTEDVGDALQFLEFCAAFGKILEVKKGQPEHVLHDLFHGRTGRRGKFSVTVQFHIHLLSILLRELGEKRVELSPSVGKNSWFDALKKCFFQTQSILKAQGLDCLEKASDYESLEASEKLKLLNFLCDEILGTEKVRSWVDKQNTKLAEKVKEARQKVTAAKDKEKTLKQKMKDDIAKAIIARNGAPLSILEHEGIVSHIKNKAEEAHAKVLESQGILLESSRICNAVRIEPLLVAHGGNAYWKLNCSGNSNVLHQDVGKGDTLTLNEKWFTIDDEGKEAVVKHICSLRGKKLRL